MIHPTAPGGPGTGPDSPTGSDVRHQLTSRALGGVLQLTIPRSHVEAAHTETALGLLQRLVDDPEKAWRYRGAISITISGYEQDQRELWQISEVRRFVGELHSRWPYWVHFLTVDDYTFHWVMDCVVPAKQVVDGKDSKSNNDADAHFLRQCFVAMNELFALHKFPLDENDALSRRTTEALYNPDWKPNLDRLLRELIGRAVA